MEKYNRAPILITNNWIVKRNEFYQIDPNSEIHDDIKSIYVYMQEDMLSLQSGLYNLDLGWYGEENDKHSGFCLHLYRGESWNDSVLLEKYRTKSYSDILDRINRAIELIDGGKFDGIAGYEITTSNGRDFGDFSQLTSVLN